MAQVLGPLPPIWQTWMELLAPGLGLAQIRPLQPFGNKPEDGSSLSAFQIKNFSFLKRSSALELQGKVSDMLGKLLNKRHFPPFVKQDWNYVNISEGSFQNRSV